MITVLDKYSTFQVILNIVGESRFVSISLSDITIFRWHFITECIYKQSYIRYVNNANMIYAIIDENSHIKDLFIKDLTECESDSMWAVVFLCDRNVDYQHYLTVGEYSPNVAVFYQI